MFVQEKQENCFSLKQHQIKLFQGKTDLDIKGKLFKAKTDLDI